jgi:hypothetical protein
MIAVIAIGLGAIGIFAFGFFVGVNNAKSAQAKIDAAKSAADAAKNILKNQ